MRSSNQVGTKRVKHGDRLVTHVENDGIEIIGTRGPPMPPPPPFYPVDSPGSKRSVAGQSDEYDSILSEGQTDPSSSTQSARRHRQKKIMKWYMRLVLLILAGLIGILVSGVVYYAARQAEVKSFNTNFFALGQQVSEIIQERLFLKLTALDGLSIAFTSFTLQQQQLDRQTASLKGGTNWPAMSLPNFDVVAANTLAASNSESVILAPIVTNATLALWNSFLAKSDYSPPDSPEESANAFQNLQQRDTTQSPLIDPSTSVRIWQHFPRFNDETGLLDFDLLSNPTSSLLTFLSTQQVVLSSFSSVSFDSQDSDSARDPLMAYHEELAMDRNWTGLDGLSSSIYYPVFDSFNQENKSLVALLSMDIFWKNLFSNGVLLGPEEDFVCVVRNQCGEVYTLTVGQHEVTKIEDGDRHDTNYDLMQENWTFTSLMDARFSASLQSKIDDFCLYEVDIYPTLQFQRQYLTFKPALYTASTALCLIIIFIVSLAYERRVAQVHESATQYRAVVSNLFPPAVRQRMFRQQELSRRRRSKQENTKLRKARSSSTVSRLMGQSQLDRSKDPGIRTEDTHLTDVQDLTLWSKPIADHFQNATVLFADIAGFTSWSSSRNPEQVFTLLQTLFNTFDGIAKKRRVFKVETIGDCYMAVTGVPEPQEDHAVRMVRFARECLQKVKPTLQRLEGTLGQGTVNLAMRVGLHSGPVTAGVLQGEKSRFQLFGDTVNTASRMESNGQPGEIHISKSTADLLLTANKGHWMEKRKDPIHAKGKGVMETYWIRRSSNSNKKSASPSGSRQESWDTSDSENLSDSEKLLSSFTSSTSRLSDSSSWNDSSRSLSTKGNESQRHSPMKGNIALYDLPSFASSSAQDELIDWHVRALGKYLKKILKFRESQGAVTKSPMTSCRKGLIRSSCPLDEISEVIPVPELKSKHVICTSQTMSSELPQACLHQLREFVSTIAQSYRSNAFHNFARATHTAMFMNQFMEEICRRGQSAKESECLLAIASDPFIQFALMFAALIHDADHPGIPNDLLAREQPEFAKIYKKRIISEQHSLELSWELLMNDGFKELLMCICSTRGEVQRLRQILVNVVLATDRSDKEMNGIASLRWEEAFTRADMMPGKGRKRMKLSVTVELLLQAADISHTAQAWSVFTRWSKKMYLEAYEAYIAGRSHHDPAKLWYAREAFMFDQHAIPLLEKLAFITGWDNLLENARSNRKEWIACGKQQVKEFASEAILLQQAARVENASTREPKNNNGSYRFTLKET